MKPVTDNKYALLNYDMDRGVETPEYQKANQFIDEVVTEMTTAIKSQKTLVPASEIGRCFYGNLHWGRIGENRVTGDARVDKLIATAVKRLVKFSDGPESDGGIGDTATDEAIAYEVDRLMNAKPAMIGGGLLNRE